MVFEDNTGHRAYGMIPSTNSANMGSAPLNDNVISDFSLLTADSRGPRPSLYGYAGEEGGAPHPWGPAQSSGDQDIIPYDVLYKQNRDMAVSIDLLTELVELQQLSIQSYEFAKHLKSTKTDHESSGSNRSKQLYLRISRKRSTIGQHWLRPAPKARTLNCC